MLTTSISMNQAFEKSLQSQLALLDSDLTPLTPRRVKETSSEEDYCTCGLPNKKYCMLASLSRKEREHRKRIVWAPMSICKVL